MSVSSQQGASSGAGGCSSSSSHTVSYSVVTQSKFLASAFLGLPQPGPVHGLQGFVDLPSLGVGYFKIPWESLFGKNGIIKDRAKGRKFADEIPIADEDQELPKWEKHDLDRLGFTAARKMLSRIRKNGQKEFQQPMLSNFSVEKSFEPKNGS